MDDGYVMGVRHTIYPIEGVQFHPESILSPEGDRIITEFLIPAWSAIMNMKETIARLIERQDLTHDEAGQVMGAIMEGTTTQTQIGAFLTALRMKGETPVEIAAFARVMRQHAVTVAPVTGKNAGRHLRNRG